MAGLSGADLELLRRLGRTVEGKAQQLERVSTASRAQIHGSAHMWHGPDAASFRNTWQTVHAPALVACVRDLREMAATLARNADAQEATSAAVLGGPGIGVAGQGSGLIGGSSDGDQAGEGKIKDGVRVTGWSPTGDPLFRRGTDSAGNLDMASIDPNDVDQNSLGDCYFVSALAALADDDPHLIRDNISDNGDGTYTVTLYDRVDGELQPIEVTVNGDMPDTERYDDETGRWVTTDRFTAGEADGELWPRIYEKAYASYLGDGDLVAGYREIIGGDGADSLQALTGVEATTVSTSDLTVGELRELTEEGAVLPASQRYVPGSGVWVFGRDTGNYSVGDDTIVTRHQYWVEEVRDNGEIVVRNPHDYDKQEIVMTIEEFNDAFREVDHTPHR